MIRGRARPSTTSSKVFEISGNKGQQWNMARLEIRNSMNIAGVSMKIRFTGKIGKTSKSDIALDDICIAAGPCGEYLHLYLKHK